METKMLTSYLLAFFCKVEIFFVKSHIATHWRFIPSQTGVLPHIGEFWIIFIAM